MMTSSRLFLLSLVASTGFAVAAHAQNAAIQPSIEVNQNVLQSLGGGDTGANSDAAAAPRNYPHVYEPITIGGVNPDSRTTTITPATGQPRLVWVKGPDGQQVELKPDPKPRKKRVKKAKVVSDAKQCPCPDNAKAAPVEEVKEAEKKQEETKAEPVKEAPAPAPEPAPAAPATSEPAAPAAALPAPPAAPPAPPSAAAAAPEPAAAVAKETPLATDGKADISIAFKATETALPLTNKEQMDALVSKLKANEALRVNLIAYASSAPDQENTARRVSLSRALSVRAYLIDSGVGNLRINVQAEGDKNAGGEPDRVDVFVVSQ